jgi:hypothetical protein
MKMGNAKKQVSGSYGDSGKGGGAHGVKSSSTNTGRITTRQAGAGSGGGKKK